MTRILSRVDSLVQQASNNTERYQTTLSDKTATLTNNESSTFVETVSRLITDETRRILSEQKLLQTRLSESARQIEDLQRNLQVVQQETRTDALTGVANRKKFDTALRQEVKRVRDRAGSLCLILADIDHFKKINDAHGHPMGDQVLKFVASAIAGAVEQKDLVARYGGEEFVVILPNSSLRDGVKIAEKMRFTIGRRRLQKRKTGESIGTVTLSFGVALYKPTESISDFFKRADDCLYMAKKRGRNKVISESQLESAAA